MRYLLEQSDETITTHSGLALAGLLLSKTKLEKKLNRVPLPDRTAPNISHFEIIASYIGLLCQGKSDFDHIEPFRRDPFFRQSLMISNVSSSPTLRQRMDMGAKTGWAKLIVEQSVSLLGLLKANITPCLDELVPLDIDVSPFDNSGTKKEGVSCTYKKIDGYAPVFAYLGEEGYGVNVELREGKEHSQNNTPSFLEQSIENARLVTSSKLFVRMDSGFDSINNIKICIKENCDYLIKRNLRRESKEEWLTIAQKQGRRSDPRPGKITYSGETFLAKDLKQFLRVIFKVTETTIDEKGQVLLIPDIVVDTYWTSLKHSPEEVIKQYQNHGTSEQFHSEIKTELDLERLPSGKF